MFKKIRFGLVFAVLLSYLFQPINNNAAAETLGDLEANVNSLKQKKQDNQKNKNMTEEQIKQKEQAIKNAEKQIQKARFDHSEAEQQLNDTNQKIEESNIKIEELKKESEKLLQFMQQMENSNAYMEYITGASSTADMIMRMAAVNQITQYNQESLEKLEALIKENEQLKIDLIKKQEELKVKEQQLNTQIDVYQTTINSLNDKMGDYDKYETDIDTQIKQAESTYQTYKKICSDNPNTKDLGNKATLSQCEHFPDGDDNGPIVNYGWKKPLTHGVITSTIGTRWGSYHNALDIGGNPEGTNIYSATNGTVAGIIWRYWCGGNMLYINSTVNGQKYTIYYYHMLSINVSLGQVVNVNTILGAVGGGRSTSSAYGGYDSCTTGAHLHFGVAKGYYTGTINKNNVITPPGFPNQTGYSFNNRDAYWQ